MAESDPSLSPEKRLLQLIESGGQTPSGGGRSVQKESPIDRLKAIFTSEALRSFIEGQRESWSSAFGGGSDFLSLRGLNKIAKLVTVVLAVYLLISMVYEVHVVNSNFVSDLQTPQRELEEISLSDKRIFETNILNEPEKLNVFLPLSKREVKKEESSEMSLKLVGMIKDWKLAGISIYPNNPERTFCMIEDLQKNTTFFLKVGDTLAGLKIDKISSDSVLLRLNEETIELR